jgi:hypothetical protein
MRGWQLKDTGESNEEDEIDVADLELQSLSRK